MTVCWTCARWLTPVAWWIGAGSWACAGTSAGPEPPANTPSLAPEAPGGPPSGPRAPSTPPPQLGTFVPGDPAMCLTGGNVLVLSGDGNSNVHPGLSITRDAEFQVLGHGQNYISVRVKAKNWVRRPNHSVTFSGRRLFGPLKVGNYPQADQAAFAKPGHAGLSVSSNHEACGESNGNFYIHDIVWLDQEVMRFTATFTINCVQRHRHQPRGPLPPVPDPNAKVTVDVASISGCVHYEHGQ